MKPKFITWLLWSVLSATGLSITGNTSAEPAATASQMAKYVTDKLVIMLRAGPSNKHKIVGKLSSGAKLYVLESGEKYDKVRTNNTKEGWVLNQYLTDKPPANLRLQEANKQISKLQTEKTRLQEQLSQLNDAYKKVKEEHRILDKEKSEMEGELSHIRDVAATPIELSNKNRELAAKSLTMESQIEALKQELQQLRDDSQKQWFLTGAGVVLLGILIGLMVPKLRRRRRSDWSNLN